MTHEEMRRNMAERINAQNSAEEAEKKKEGAAPMHVYIADACPSAFLVVASNIYAAMEAAQKYVDRYNAVYFAVTPRPDISLESAARYPYVAYGK